MRAATVDGRFCLVTDRGVVDVATASGGRFGPSPDAVYQAWDAFRAWSADAELEGGEPISPTDFGPPSPCPSLIFAIGLNYRDHATESGVAPPSSPPTFTKFRSALAGPHGSLVIPDGTVDWEVELVAVIGRRAENVATERGWDHVAGLTVGQDYSERTRQLEGATPQYSLAKSFRGFAPIGPVLVTPDEFDDPDDLRIQCDVNGVTMQDGRTSSLIFSVPELVSRLSAICSLEPGDLIFTGTPAGVGAARTPPQFLRPGDVVTSSIENIGQIVQHCVSAEHDHAASPASAQPDPQPPSAR